MMSANKDQVYLSKINAVAWQNYWLYNQEGHLSKIDADAVAWQDYWLHDQEVCNKMHADDMQVILL